MSPEINKKDRDSDFGPNASGWKPGDEDPNTIIVHEESDPDRPGIATTPQFVSFGGMLITAEQAELLRDQMRGDEES